MNEKHKIIDMQARRKPVTYTIQITHNWDDSFVVFVEGVSDSDQAQASVNHAIARIAENKMNEKHIHAAILARIDALMDATDEHEAGELSRLADICVLYESLAFDGK